MSVNAISLKQFSIRFISLLFAFVFLLTLLVTQLQAYALSPEQKKVYRQGINYFDVSTCGPGSGSAGDGVVPDINVSYRGNKINPSETVIRYLLKAQAATKVPASVLLAQGAVESGDAGWWDKTKMGNTKTVKYSYFNGGGKKSLNEEFAGYDNNAAGHGPMQLDNWPGSYNPRTTGNYNDKKFADFKKGAIDQFGAEDSLNPKNIGNIAMMWDTSILFAAVVDADVVRGDPTKASTDEWARVLWEYGTLQNVPASVTQDWKELRDKLAPLLDNASATSDAAQATGDIAGAVYMVGDSIAEGAKKDLETAIKAKNTEVFINASSSRSITKAGTSEGYKTSGLGAIQSDIDRIKNSKNVVISLGTNQRDSNFEESIKKMVEAVKAANPDANIFWVNVFSEGTGSDKIDMVKINKSIEDQSASLNFKVIDTVKKGIEVGNDNTHPTTEGSQKYATIVASGLGDAESPSDASGCKCEAGTLLAGSDNKEKIWNFLIGKGLTAKQTAGIMGNLEEESGFDPRAYFPGTKTDNPSPPTPFGIAQWKGTRQTALRQKAQDAGVPITDLGVQLKHLWDELNGTYKSKVLDKIKATQDLTVIATVWNNDFEVSGAPTGPRVEKAIILLAKLGSGGGGGESAGSDSASCNTDEGSGNVVGKYSLPVPKKFFDSNKVWFTKPHHPPNPAADIPVPDKTKVFAVGEGKVTSSAQSGYNGGMGTHVLIKDGDVVYGYFHGTIGSVKVKIGDTVKAGQLLMVTDDTGRSDGTHLHFQIEISGVKHCPQNLLKAIGEGKPPPDIKSLPKSGCVG